MKEIGSDLVYARNITEMVHEAMVVLDADLRILAASNSFYRQFQLKPEDTLDRLIYDLGNGQWQIPGLKLLLETILPERGNIEGYELRHNFNNSGEKVLLVNARRIEWSDLIFLAISDLKEVQIMDDPSGCRQLQETLRDLETKLQKIQSVKTVGVLFFSLNGPISGANATFERMSGYSSEELRVIPHWKVLTTPEFWDITAKSAENIAKWGDTPPYEKQMFRKDGSRWWGLFTPSAISGSGLNSQCIEFIIDITERKKAEEALQQRTNELAATNRELESFSYSVSHDLRTPLTAIHGFSDLLKERYSVVLDKNGKKILNHIISASEKMASIIDNLLMLARISRESMNCKEIDLSPIANSIVNDLRQTNPQRNVRVSIAEAMPANADSRFVTIILTNLIGNAWKYTGKRQDAIIDIGIEVIENTTVYYIRDNGAGFDMSRAQNLFQPFQRLHSQNQFAGTGIGLAIVHNIIQRHGGRIWAESEVGKGSTFYFTLQCPFEAGEKEH